MAEALLVEAALGVAFAALYEAINVTTIKNVNFKRTVDKIKSTLTTLEPLIKEPNERLDLKPEVISGYISKLEKGAKLIKQCSKVHRCNICMKPHYLDELQDLDASLNSLMQMLMVQDMRDKKKNVATVNEIHRLVFENTDNRAADNGSTALCNVPERPSFSVGLDGPLEELKRRLLHGDKSLLLITAMGGSGKTLLAQMFCHDPQVKGTFKDNIFFITVSKTPPSLSDVVQRLYKRKRIEVPNRIEEVDAVNHLKKLLNQMGETTPILLVLDDVWANSKSLVLKLLFQRPDFKILVTSRSELQGLGPPDFAPPYHLSPLNDEDAMTLFSHWMKDGKSGIADPIVNKIVNYYKVFLPGLKTVAESFHEKPSEFWQSDASLKLSTSELLACLQSQLEDLNGTVKECFMDLGSFPENKKIPAATLIDMWTELYHLNADADAIVKLFNLTIRNLASLIVTRKDVKEKDGYYSKHFVTQPGLLRDLSMHLSSEDPVQREKLIIDLREKSHLPNWWDKCEEKSFKARLLAISSGKKLPSELSELKLSEAKALVLNFWSWDYDLPEFVENLTKLKVLIVTSHDEFLARLKNFELLGRSESLRRIRLERISIPSLTLVRLKNLQKISFYMCSIGKAFSNCKTKFSDLFPNLVEMSVDFCHDFVELPDEICDVESLTKLSVSYCTKLRALPEEIGKLENLRELRLRCCISLVGLPDSIGRLSNLTFLDIYDCISIESFPEELDDLRNLTKLNMKGCSRLPALPWSVTKLTRLEDLICDEEIHELWELFLPYLPRTVLRLAKEDINLDWLPNFSTKITV